ncbi:hypothetical protein O9993_00075 [Vibrio lentus]|nr:hypothetical protein [Vibrio lentus]
MGSKAVVNQMAFIAMVVAQDAGLCVLRRASEDKPGYSGAL